MEKYGVKQVETLPNNKHANDAERCPLCGLLLVTHGTVKLCKQHGSLPLEDTTTNED